MPQAIHQNADQPAATARCTSVAIAPVMSSENVAYRMDDAPGAALRDGKINRLVAM